MPMACSFSSSTGTGSDLPRYSTGRPTRRSVTLTYDGVMRASVLSAAPQARAFHPAISRAWIRARLRRSAVHDRSQGTVRAAGVVAQGGGDAGVAGQPQDGDWKVAQAGHDA